MCYGNPLDQDDGGIPDAPRLFRKEQGGEVRCHGETDHGVHAPLARMAPEDRVALVSRVRFTDDPERLGPVGPE